MLSKYTIFVSSMYLLPFLYGCYKQKYMLSAVSFASAVSSIYSCMNPSLITIRNVNIIICKSSGLIYFLYGYNNINSSFLRLVGYTNFFFILSAYNSFHILHELKSDTWESFHMMFNILTVIGHILVLTNS